MGMKDDMEGMFEQIELFVQVELTIGPCMSSNCLGSIEPMSKFIELR